MMMVTMTCRKHVGDLVTSDIYIYIYIYISVHVKMVMSDNYSSFVVIRDDGHLDKRVESIVNK
jgi:hypothetical protein